MRSAFNLLVFPNSMLFFNEMLSGEIALENNHYYYYVLGMTKYIIGFQITFILMK